MTQSVHPPPKSWALNFWKMKFLHFPFFSRAEDFLSQGNTSLRISIEFHFSIWLNTIDLKKIHIIKRDVKTIYLWVLYRDKMNHFFNMTQTVRSFICGRFIIYYFYNHSIFYNDASRPTIHLWALYRDFLFKIITFSTWRKPSDHSFVGASSIFFFKWIDFLKWRKTSNHPSMGALSRLSL